MRAVAWLLRAVLFVALFAFALNNRQPVTLHGLFGAQWQTPLVWVLLLTFAAGALLGVLAMLPHWWRARAEPAPNAAPADALDSQAPPLGAALPLQPRGPAAEHPPRVGL